MDDPQRLTRYFEPTQWTGDALSVLRGIDRDPDRHELAPFTFELLQDRGLCADHDDWTILTNRLISDRFGSSEVVLSPLPNTNQWHFRRHAAIRGAVHQAVKPGYPRQLDLAELARISGASRTDVDGVVRTMINGPTGSPRLSDAEYITPDVVSFRSMSLAGNFAGIGAEHYPHQPLLSLYAATDQVLGSGAWGAVTVHRLTAPTTWSAPMSEFAVKLASAAHMRRMLGADDELAVRARVLREFRFGRRHSSPNLMKTFDVFAVELHGNNRTPTLHYGLVMEWVKGAPLSLGFLSGINHIARGQIALGLIRAVGAFHQLGVHRDVKPGNAVLREGTVDGVVLLDYGIAKGDTDDTITDSHAGFAALYASPQQLENATDEDRADDVYSLGLSIAEILLARKPFGTIPRVKIYEVKRQGPFHDPELSQLSGDAAALVRDMTMPERDMRPSIEGVERRFAGIILPELTR